MKKHGGHFRFAGVIVVNVVLVVVVFAGVKLVTVALVVVFADVILVTVVLVVVVFDESTN